MNLIGKVLTVLVCVMSVMFLTFAVVVRSTHKNWRTVAINSDPKSLGLKEQLEELAKVYKQLNDESKRQDQLLAAEQASRKYMIEEMALGHDEIFKRLVVLKDAYERSILSHGQTVESLRLKQNALDAIVQQLDLMRVDWRNALQARDDKYRALVGVTEQLRAQSGRVSVLEGENSRRIESIAKMENVLRLNNVSLTDDVEKIPPRIDGIVSAVKKDLMEITLGTDDGLKIGHELDVVRKSGPIPKFLGRVTVIVIDKNSAVAKVLPEYKSAPIEPNDIVYTYIKKKT